MINLDDWLDSYQDLQLVGINSSVSVRGMCKKVLGGRVLYAEVELYFAESNELKFISALSGIENQQAYDKGWLKGVYLGVLDVMLVKPLVPITVFSCTVNAIRFHKIDSNMQAFRVAGRYAAEQFLEQEKFVVF